MRKTRTACHILFFVLFVADCSACLLVGSVDCLLCFLGLHPRSVLARKRFLKVQQQQQLHQQWHFSKVNGKKPDTWILFCVNNARIPNKHLGVIDHHKSSQSCNHCCFFTGAADAFLACASFFSFCFLFI
ncbi:hypothetical protein BX070DRAFT_18148 [Coemansia spiralis]|nr:hypothetical protein BX070DRAFT_18148 [Coemansia spiralis]